MQLYNIALIVSPFYPNLELAGHLLIKLHVPYSEKSVTVKINPKIEEYKEKPAENIWQSSISVDTPETKTLTFDLEKNNKQTVKYQNRIYSIELKKIGKILEQGQNFPVYDFIVSES